MWMVPVDMNQATACRTPHQTPQNADDSMTQPQPSGILAAAERNDGSPNSTSSSSSVMHFWLQQAAMTSHLGVSATTNTPSC